MKSAMSSAVGGGAVAGCGIGTNVVTNGSHVTSSLLAAQAAVMMPSPAEQVNHTECTSIRNWISWPRMHAC